MLLVTEPGVTLALATVCPMSISRQKGEALAWPRAGCRRLARFTG